MVSGPLFVGHDARVLRFPRIAGDDADARNLRDHPEQSHENGGKVRPLAEGTQSSDALLKTR